MSITCNNFCAEGTRILTKQRTEIRRRAIFSWRSVFLWFRSQCNP